MAQILRPDGDDFIAGDWEPEPSDTNLWDVIDEASPNDADYVWTDACSAGEYFEVTLSNPGAAPGAGAGTIRWRVARIDGAKIPYMQVVLYEGVATRWTGPAREVTDSWTTHVETVPAETMATIINFDDLELRFRVDSVGGGGKGADPAVSWAEVEVPDAGVLYVPKVIMIT